MPFIPDILKYNSLSIVGIEKNTGKTECLNYILGRLQSEKKCIAVTSIGLDGERTDQVGHTVKPEIRLYEGMIFATSEKHYRERRLLSEVIDVSRETTALGKVVTARVIHEGKVLLSGPSTNAFLRQLMRSLSLRHGVELCIIDGALSRMSLASPALAQAMVLATGAAYSAHLPTLVRQTRFIYDLIALGLTTSVASAQMRSIHHGVWALDEEEALHELSLPSAFSLELSGEELFRYGTRFFLAGALNNRFLQSLIQSGKAEGSEVILTDFTKIFVRPELFYDYRKRGGNISVLQKTKLIAVCINPVSPSGYVLNPDKLKAALEESLGIPVYNIKSGDTEIT